MTHSVIVENLSKQYRIGRREKNTTMREALMRLVKQPFRKRDPETIWALKDISFAIKKGEVVGIIGRNGAGKSTLLKALAKITYPTSGRVRVNGRVASLLEVGTGFHEELTGRENIYLNGSILGMTKKEMDAQLESIIAFAGVEKFIDTPIKRYSSGMRLRLGFAIAAHLNPDVLLVDEVLAVGDMEFQKKCLKSMDDLRSSGRTVLFVSHNMAAIENLCPRTIWIDQGQVRQDGDTAEVIKAYLSTFTTAQEADLDLFHIKDRAGIGGIRYSRIEFLNIDRQPLKLIRSGESLIARLHYCAEKYIQAPHFGLELYTELGTLITSFNTWTTGFNIPTLPSGSGCIELEIDSLNFVPGRYYISLWLSSVGIEYDRLNHCTILDVEGWDVYKSGRKLDSRYFGIVFFPYHWKLDEQIMYATEWVENDA